MTDQMRYAALLCGVDGERRRKVPVARLRALLADLGYLKVDLCPPSGDAVFTAPTSDSVALGVRLENALAERFGQVTRCLVLSAAELRATVDRCPFPTTELDATKLLVTFLDRAVGCSQVPGGRAASAHPSAETHPGGGEIFAYFPHGVAGSRLGPVLSTAAPGGRSASRTWRTLVRLLSLMDENRMGARANPPLCQ